MDTDALKPILAGIVRHILTTAGGALVTDGYLQSSDVTGFVGAGMVFAGIVWSWWQKSGQAEVGALLKKMTSRSTVQDAVATAKVTQIVAKVLIAAFVASFLLAGGQAFAAPLKRPAVTGNPIADIRTDLGISPTAGVTKNADGTIKCDFNIFLLLNPKNLEQVVKACVTAADSVLIQDTQGALASAQMFTQTGGGAQGDTPAVQCLQPGLAILQAAVARPAVEAVAAQPATATTPAVAAIAAQAAYNPGLITLFQKYREFVLQGGPAACQNWINGTVSGTIGPLIGAAAGAAVAVGGAIP